MRMFFAIEAAFCSAERVTMVGSMKHAGAHYLTPPDRANVATSPGAGVGSTLPTSCWRGDR